MTSDTHNQPIALWHIALLVLIPLAANFPALSGLVNCSPEMIYSGLGQNASPGLIPGNACFLDPTIAYITQPLGYLSAQDWLHGIIPWWNPYSGVGMPLAAEMQNESFFLPFVLLLHFKAGWLYQRVVFQTLSGLFTYAFLRARALHPLACLTGGILFGLNGSFFQHAGAASGPIFCLPLMMLGVEQAVACASAQRRGGWSCLALGLALSIYAGFPEIAFFDGLLVAVWTVFRALQLPRLSRLIFIRRICFAGGIGVAVTAPVLLPFLQYLLLADIAAHGGEFLTNALPRAAAPIAMLPFMYGALGLSVPPPLDAATGDMWVRFGGWIGCLPSLFALAALMRGHQDRRARLLLAGWLLAWLARDYNFFDIRLLFNLIPMVAHADAVRFAWIAREFAAYTLTAYGISDLMRGRPAKLSQLALLIGVFALGITASLAAAFPALKFWFTIEPQTRIYTLTYLVICTCSCAVCIYAMASGRILRVVPAALIAGALSIFLLPQGAAPRGGTLDMAPIAKLQTLTGLSRIYTLGPFGPNFPASYGIASINHSQLPAPKLWTLFITNNLFPGGNVIDFAGNEHDQIYGLISNLANYQALGVKYILSGPGQNLADWKPPPRAITARSGFAVLVPQSEVSGVLTHAATDTIITNASIFIGTVGGESTGPMILTLCAASLCASGQIDTATIPDDSRAIFTLDKALPVAKNAQITFTIAHPHGAWVAAFLTGGDNGIAAAMAPSNAGTLYFAKSHAAPAAHYIYSRTIPPVAADPASLKLIYSDPLISIHELPNAAPYASTNGPWCSLQTLSRQHFIADCSNPSTLTRRELFFPGWQASINHHETLVTQTADIFQAVALPAGHSDIRFTYQPPHTHLACMIAILGCLTWILLTLRERRRP